MTPYAFGDVHGCFLTQQALEKKMGITAEDLIIFCGDLVDRGPRIKETLDYALSRPNTRIVIGNHDFCFIDTFRPKGEERNAFMYFQGLKQTLDQLGNEAQAYAERLSKKAETKIKVGRYVLCHADYNWGKGERFQYDHMWTRIDTSTHKDYEGPIIVHGHTPCSTENMYDKKEDGTIFGINLDGGAVYKGPEACLRAINLSTGQIFSQKTLDFK
jgi:serine/threonine protein phosphatase 1